MRILYDSKLPQFKDPFGTLTPGQVCRLHIHIPCAVQATAVKCLMQYEDGRTTAQEVFFSKARTEDPYEIWQADFSIHQEGLYFYYYYIDTPSGGFRLFKQGDDTNMEAGALWQVSCVPADFHTPVWARGATIYQIFPDRFRKSGDCDLTGKLTPYTVHPSWNEEVDWRPTEDDLVLNNDFFGGNFRGITEKLDYIADLGVNLLYLNPISKSFSSHRYDTGDYKTPDPMLGTEADFAELCRQAHARGIRVILDGVYSHTGSNSPYFNREGQFDSLGAYNSQESPYYSWYTFQHWPDRYTCWWNFDTLPTVNKLDPAFVKFIIEDEDSVVAHWMKLGADGFRLDVADELPDEFIRLLRRRIKAINPDALLLGEVWEDASAKIAYNRRRTYFTAGELDSVMNYPFRTAIIDYVRGHDGGAALKETVMSIVENYPPEVVQCNMNLLGTHDTPRILTALVDDFNGTREEMSKRHLSRNQFDIAYDRLLMAAFLQYTLPGSPSLYYGDEAGMEGGRDPFNRRPYPWGRENTEILDHFRQLGKLRREHPAFRLGDIRFFQAGDRHIGFTRSYAGKTYRVCCNRSADPWEVRAGAILMGFHLQMVTPDSLILAPRGFCVTEEA
ncbi:MAG TPA: alpha-glycosidase [Clostridiales bacterium]|nr:alpha-glycosidase [Clostridiales bacterium]